MYAALREQQVAEEVSQAASHTGLSASQLSQLEMTHCAGCEEDGCAICLCDYEKGEKITTLACGHGFHEACAFKWLALSQICPMCKQHALGGRSERSGSDGTTISPPWADSVASPLRAASPPAPPDAALTHVLQAPEPVLPRRPNIPTRLTRIADRLPPTHAQFYPSDSEGRAVAPIIPAVSAPIRPVSRPEVPRPPPRASFTRPLLDSAAGRGRPQPYSQQQIQVLETTPQQHSAPSTRPKQPPRRLPKPSSAAATDERPRRQQQPSSMPKVTPRSRVGARKLFASSALPGSGPATGSNAPEVGATGAGNFIRVATLDFPGSASS